MTEMRTLYKEKGITIVETPPQLKTIKVIVPRKDGDTNFPKSKSIFHLSFPYIQFYLRDSTEFSRELCLTFSKKPIQSIENSKVCFPFLPNVYPCGLSVCLFLMASENISEAIEKFWTTSFYVWPSWYGCWAIPSDIKKHNLKNFNYFCEPYNFCPVALEQFRTWEEGTRKEGVDFISNLRWPKMFKNLPALWKTENGFSDLIKGKLGSHF